MSVILIVKKKKKRMEYKNYIYCACFYIRIFSKNVSPDRNIETEYTNYYL